MERITAFLVIFSMNFAIQSFPIENGFSLKFNPIFAKEDLTPKTFGALFAKIPQEFKPKDEIRREVLTKAYFPQKSEVPTGYTNQVAKLIFPYKYIYNGNNTGPWGHVNFINLPLIRQPYDNYKILVATAPPNMPISTKNKRMILYVVLPEDGSSESSIYDMPTIYFVNEKGLKAYPVKKEPIDPILIVDSNRTVTGLKSKEISKFVRFKNKRTDRYNYKVLR